MAAAMLSGAGGEWPPDEREQYDETLSTITAGLPPEVGAEALLGGRCRDDTARRSRLRAAGGDMTRTIAP
jgi:hypothetical protein